MPGPEIRLLDPGVSGGLTWGMETLAGGSLRGNPVECLRGSLADQWSHTRSGSADGPTVTLPFRAGFLRHPAYWLRFFLLLAARGPKAQVIDHTGGLVPALAALVRATVVLYPLYSFAILLRLPFYLVSQVIPNFVRAGDGADEIVGYGAGKGSGGLVYWNYLVRKSRQVGQFGLGDAYWGVPLSVHSWPLALVALRILRFRLYTGLAAILLSLALAYVAVVAGHPWVIALLPLIFLSPYALYNLYVGTWETLGWGTAAVGIVAMAEGHPALSGVLVGLTLLIHPGVAELAVLALLAGGVFRPPSVGDVAVFGFASGMTCFWFLIPYLRARSKLGRGRMINAVFEISYRWGVRELYQLATYLLFAGAAFATLTEPVRALPLLVPIVLLWVNVKLRWIFSPYTLLNCMLVLGAILVMSDPSTLLIALYLLIIFTSPALLWGGGVAGSRGFDLSPVRFGATRELVTTAFRGLERGRVGFESDGLGTDLAYAVATLSYLLADEPVELANGSYVEVGDATLYFDFVRHLNAVSDERELERACRGFGVRYMVAFTDEFASALRALGARSIDTVSGVRLLPQPDRPAMSFELFELPWQTSLIDPATDLTLGRNELSFAARAGTRYRLCFTHFAGWRAMQGGRPIRLADAEPGMVLVAPEDGTVTLRYRYRNYFLPAHPDPVKYA